MIPEAGVHLQCLERRSLACFLHCHTELHDIEEELQQQLVLFIPSLLCKGEERFSILHGQCGSKSHAGSFAGLNHIERIFLLIKHEALHALAHPDASVACYTCRHPPTAGGY